MIIPRMPSRLSAFVIWAVVALSATYWALRLLAASAAVPSHAAPASIAMAPRADLGRLLGAADAPAVAGAAAPAETSSRYKLVGVAAPTSGSADDGGVALIAVDGKPARPFRLGATVDGDLALVAVEQRSASLGSRGGAPTMVLELPRLPPPATGNLPPAPTLSGATPAQPPAAPAATPAPPVPAAPGLARVPRTDADIARPVPPAPPSGEPR